MADSYRGFYRDDEHSPEELADLYAADVGAICDKLKSVGKKPSCFIAESLQSCGGQIIYPPGYLAKVYESVAHTFFHDFCCSSS